MAVHLAAADDILVMANFVLSFLTWCLEWDLGLNCQFLRIFLLTLVAIQDNYGNGYESI